MADARDSHRLVAKETHVTTYRLVTADDDGNFYAIDSDGALNFYRDRARNGKSGFSSWADPSPQVIGSGWNDVIALISGGCGVLYAVNSVGNLMYYRDKARDGSQEWAWGGVGQTIGTGWSDFRHIVSGGNGVLYAVTATGELVYYRDEAQDGTENWAYSGTGQTIGSGWDQFTKLLTGGNGVLYAVNAAGELQFYRDRAQDGSVDWACGGVGQTIGTGWDRFANIIGGGYGILYATTPTPLAEVPLLGGSADFMYFFRDRAQDGSIDWLDGGIAQQIGSGW